MGSHDTRRPDDARGPLLDMTPDGRFASVGAPSPLTARALGVAVLVAVLAGAVALAAVLLSVALTLIPIAIGAALIAYGVFRFRLWRARRAAFGGRRGVLPL